MENKSSFFNRIFCGGKVNFFIQSNDGGDVSEHTKDSLMASVEQTLSKTQTKQQKEEIIEEVKQKVELKKPIEEKKEVVFHNSLMGDDDLDANTMVGGLGFNNGKLNGIMTNAVDLDEHRNMDLSKTPIVSGLIFEEQDDKDSIGFDFKNTMEKQEEEIQQLDEDAIELIEMLKNQKIEKEHEIEELKKASEGANVKNVEYDIDIPLL